MPRKSKKDTEIQPIEPENATELTQESGETAPDREAAQMEPSADASAAEASEAAADEKKPKTS